MPWSIFLPTSRGYSRGGISPLSHLSPPLESGEHYSWIAEVQEARVSRPTCREEQAHHSRLHAGPLSVIDLFFSSFR